ncbi:hypothetical protein GJAV_G00157950 [Gymnothorax javanicus]|nr:hypothetical protein GJAV_G00157950 [Gymnothorax javanicus]
MAMGSTPSWLLWYVAMVGCTVRTQHSEDTQLPEITDQTFISQCVNSHNQYRASVNPSASNMLYMTWDEALAITARAWARHCKFIHNPRLDTHEEVHPTFQSVGENLWVGTPASYFSVERAVKLWHDEVAHYRYVSNECSPGEVCGHYTQVVWATSYKVGCAVQNCPNGVQYYSSRPGAIFVCNYGDAGNYLGVKPFKTGRPCSACGADTCRNSLCRNNDRDQLKRYDWQPHWDPGYSSCDSYCVAVLGRFRFLSSTQLGGQFVHTRRLRAPQLPQRETTSCRGLIQYRERNSVNIS